MMSGDANGLRASVWKIAPDSPNAAPTSAPTSARGRRSSPTTNRESSLPPPSSVTITSRIGIGKSPTEIVQQNSTKTAPTSAADTAIERTSSRADTGPIRTM